MRTAILMPGLLLFFISSSFAQKIDSALSAFRKKFPGEKIYIHYNKTSYTAGETIWFKAYLAVNNKPSPLSNNFYLQLSDGNGMVISNKKYPVKAATVTGSIDIPDTIARGTYTVRAFTPVMLNPDAGLIYSNDIYIHSSRSSKTDDKLPADISPKVSLCFFPEGGSLVADIKTVLAFKAMNEFGEPVEVKGFIKSGDGTMIVPFSSYHDGIGQVLFKPQANKQYIAVAEINGQQSNFLLPPVQLSGLELKIEAEDKGKAFVVSRDKTEKLNFETFWVVAQIRNVVVYENDFYFGDHYAVKGHLLTDSLPSGILQFTVFNSDDIPILERLSFVNNKEYESGVSLSILQQGTKPRQFNSLEFDFPDSAQRSCSVAVTDANNNSTNKENIISSFLLTSDLRGKIYNPAYYFGNPGDSITQAMDNLMLTHGWRRFNWKEVLQNEYTEQKSADEFLLTISGTVKNEKTTAIMQGGELTVFIVAEDSALTTFNFPVNENGHIVMDSMFFSGTAKIYYSYKNAEGKQKPVTLFLDEQKSPEWPAAEPGEEDKMNTTKPGDIVNAPVTDVKKIDMVQKGYENAKELQTVTVKAKARRPVDILNDKYTSGYFKTGDQYMIDNDPPVYSGGGGTIISFIKNRVPKLGFQVDHFVNMNHFSAIGGELVYWRVAIFIDEVRATTSQLEQLRIEQVAFIKFFDAGFIGAGSEYGGGAIAVYTNNNEVPAYKSPKATFISYKGFSIEKEFYSPDYSIEPGKQNEQDARSTLSWKSALYTGPDENCIQVNFFNNDISKKFKVILQGFDNKGRLIYLERTIGGGL